MKNKNSGKTYRSDSQGYSFLVLLITIAVSVVIVLLKYLLEKLEIIYPELFARERSIPEIIIYSLIILFSLVYLLFTIIFLRIWHSSLSYTITDSEIISKSGFWVKSEHIMKLSSVQFVTGISMPLSKYSSFNFIIVSALGGTLMMMFLSDGDYAEIKELLDFVCGGDSS